MRHTRSHTKNRRSHHALSAPALSVCTHCGAHHRPHHMCLACGYYNGRQVIDLETQKSKREARMQAKRDLLRAETTEASEPRSTVPEDKQTEKTKGGKA